MGREPHSAITKHENSRSNFTPQQVQVIIQNQTGGNAFVAGSQLAPG